MARVEWGGEPERMVFSGPAGMVVMGGAVVVPAWWIGGAGAAGLAAGSLVIGMVMGWMLLGRALAFDGWVIAYVKNAKGKRRYIVGKEEKPEVVEQPKAVVRWL